MVWSCLIVFFGTTKSKLSLQELEGLSSREVQRVRLPVIQEGELDALAVWFQLHLDEKNSLSTGPQEDTCWEQAIYPVHSAKGTSQ